MCKTPVTFGGGITMVNGGLFECASALKYPPSSQNLYIASSVDFASYTVGKSLMLILSIVVSVVI